MSSNLPGQRHLALLYSGLGRLHALLREIKRQIDEYGGSRDERRIICPNCGEHVVKQRSTRDKQVETADQVDSVTVDIFFDCASRFSRNTSSASIDRLSINFTGSPNNILERSHSFLPEQYTTDGHFSNSVFVVAIKQHLIQCQRVQEFYLMYAETPRLWRRVIVSVSFNRVRDSTAILPYSASDNLDCACKVLPNAVGQIIITLLPQLRLFDTVTRLRLSAMEDKRDEIINEPSKVELLEDCTESAVSNEDSILQDLDDINCPNFLESEVAPEQQISSYFMVRVNGQRYVERKLSFASAGRPGENGFCDFVDDLKLLSSLRGCRRVAQLFGVVVDDERLHLRSYLCESLRVSYCEAMRIVSASSYTIPWAIRESWSIDIVSAIADIHSKGFVIGVLTKDNVHVRADGSAVLTHINTSRRHMRNSRGFAPPELRESLEMENEAVQNMTSFRTDIFQLGLILWLFATHRYRVDAAYLCAMFACTCTPRYNCPEHSNPVQLPVYQTDVPSYFSDIINQCRSSEPGARPPACRLANTLSSRGGVGAYPSRLLELLDMEVADPAYFSVCCDECGRPTAEIH